MNFSVQTYRGRPVLTWYQGLVTGGFGKGQLIIANSSYEILHVIQPANGDLADFHEFVVTPQDTALITIYRRHSGVDLRAVGGPSRGYITSGVVQEIDIATGKLLFEWDSWDGTHPPVQITETYQQRGVGDGGDGSAGRPFNYFHINSLAIDQDGDLLISGRNTCAVYKVSRKTGKIAWRLNGKKSDFTMGPRSKFWWQHHVRPHSNGRLTIFDNAANGPTVNEKQSRALILRLDTTTMHASLQKAYIHPGQTILAGAMGSAAAARRRQDVRRLGHPAELLRVLRRRQAPARRRHREGRRVLPGLQPELDRTPCRAPPGGRPAPCRRRHRLRQLERRHRSRLLDRLRRKDAGHPWPRSARLAAQGSRQPSPSGAPIRTSLSSHMTRRAAPCPGRPRSGSPDRWLADSSVIRSG